MFSQLVQKQKEERAEELWQEFLKDNTAIEIQITNIQELNEMLAAMLEEPDEPPAATEVAKIR